MLQGYISASPGLFDNSGPGKDRIASLPPARGHSNEATMNPGMEGRHHRAWGLTRTHGLCADRHADGGSEREPRAAHLTRRAPVNPQPRRRESAESYDAD
jgi:hypothetical protein